MAKANEPKGPDLFLFLIPGSLGASSIQTRGATTPTFDFFYLKRHIWTEQSWSFSIALSPWKDHIRDERPSPNLRRIPPFPGSARKKVPGTLQLSLFKWMLWCFTRLVGIKNRSLVWRFPSGNTHAGEQCRGETWSATGRDVDRSRLPRCEVLGFQHQGFSASLAGPEGDGRVTLPTGGALLQPYFGLGPCCGGCIKRKQTAWKLTTSCWRVDGKTLEEASPFHVALSRYGDGRQPEEKLNACTGTC